MRFDEQLIAWRRELHQNPELSGQRSKRPLACVSG